MEHHKFTEKEKKFLTNNISKYTYEELTEKFNIEFGTKLRKHSISDMCCKRMNLKRNCNSGRFLKGNIKKQLPVGTIRQSSNGTTYIKVFDSSLSYISGYKEPFWKPLQKKIYEDVYGEIPHDKMIIFLDNNNLNFDIDNLYCIDRKISAMMASNRWYTNNKENTLTAIKYCELFYSLKS